MRESNLSICRTLMSLNENPADRSGKEMTMDGRVKINAAKQLVSFEIHWRRFKEKMSEFPRIFDGMDAFFVFECKRKAYFRI